MLKQLMSCVAATTLALAIQGTATAQGRPRFVTECSAYLQCIRGADYVLQYDDAGPSAPFRLVRQSKTHLRFQYNGLGQPPFGINALVIENGRIGKVYDGNPYPEFHGGWEGRWEGQPPLPPPNVGGSRFVTSCGAYLDHINGNQFLLQYDNGGPRAEFVLVKRWPDGRLRFHYNGLGGPPFDINALVIEGGQLGKVYEGDPRPEFHDGWEGRWIR